LAHHYAPSVPLFLFEDDLALLDWLNQHDPLNQKPQPPALLRFDQVLMDSRVAAWNQEILSPKGDLEQAAHQLFGALRRLEKIAGIILAQKVPNTGLGAAINDRLQRASMKPQ
jgi:L-threonylcarbamoyladenylate synthase